MPRRIALTASALLAVGLGCTGSIGGSSSSALSADPGAVPAQGSGSGSGAASAPASGSSALPADPYAIPASAPPSVLVATPRVARLSHLQWENAVRDLLKLSDISSIANGVSGDALVGFDDQADALYVTNQLFQQLQSAAEQLADQVTGSPAALAALVPANAPTDLAGKANAFITSFGLRAFRRPLTAAEVSTHLGLFNQGPTLYPGVDPFTAGVSLVIQAMLLSPYFLYRTELDTAAPGATSVALNDYEVAAKLALALTNTIPDDTLVAAAAAGQLHEPADVATQAKRLLAGANGTAGYENLNFQILALGAFGGVTRDPTIFPLWATNTPAAMASEVVDFTDWIFSQGKGVKDFYSTPMGFVDSELAPIYAVTGTFSSSTDSLTQVSLDPTQRSGLLTEGGFLASSISGNSDPDLILRGVFIAERILCVNLPPPSPLATPLPPFTANETNRERVAAHTEVPGSVCATCHASLINPLGDAFENYDPIGAYRTLDHGLPVNAAASYTLDGKQESFQNGIDLSNLLAEAKETHACYAQNMMSYLHGRLIVPEDQPMLDYYARLSRAGMLSVHDMELAMVTSDAFLKRLP